MELIDPRSGQVVWADSWGAPMPPPRADGLAYIERGARTDRTVPPEDINALAMIGRETGITPRLNALNQMLNPVNSLYEAGQHSKNMLAPGRTGWERVGDLGGMLSGMAGTVAPMWAGAKGAIPAADAVMEGVAGFSAMPRAVAGEFMADEFGGMKLYHGSPHDFDKFSMDKIGTGEGAQAYGHGLYFAEAEDTAKAYRDQLQFPRIDGASTPVEKVADDLNYHRGNVEGVKKIYEGMLANGDEAAKRMAQEKLAALPEAVDRFKGRMYEVDVNANPDDFLDWDAPLSAQPQKVRDWFDSRGITPGFAGNQSGAELLQAEKGVLGAEGTTSAMREVGVPGIKYLDHGSRFNSTDGATNTRNYVVFDEKLISIVRKYGIAGAAAMLGLSTMDVERAIAGQRE